MKTKKFIQALTALTLCATMTAPVNAFAGAVTFTPGEEETVSGGDVDEAQKGQTPISLEVTAQYVVTIPAKIDLSDEEDVDWGTPGDFVYTGSGELKVEGIHLKSGQSLKVAVGNSGDGQSFALNTGDGKSTVNYEVSTDKTNFATGKLDEGNEIATWGSEEGNFEKTKELYFKTAKAVTDAGSYSGNFTFHFSVTTS